VQRQRIIAPVTFAPDSLDAATVAAELAAALEAELVLVGVAPVVPPDPSPESPTALDTLQVQAGHQRLLDQIMLERLGELAAGLPEGVRCRSVLSWGPIVPALVAAAAEQRADLIVVPIRRESELGHLAHDHADRYVLHHSDVPVVVVPTNGHRASLSES
jgi:nucleotide-binding universal stress UspA family protein